MLYIILNNYHYVSSAVEWQTWQLGVMYACEPKENFLSTCFAFGELKPNNWNTQNYMFGLQCAENLNLAQCRKVFLFEKQHVQKETPQRQSEPSVVTYKVSQVTQSWYLLCRQRFYFIFLIWGPHLGRRVSFTYIHFAKFSYYIFRPLLFNTLPSGWSFN